MKKIATDWAIMLGVIIAAVLAGMLASSIFAGSSAPTSHNDFNRGYSVGFCVSATLGNGAESNSPNELEAISRACTCVTDRLSALIPPGAPFAIAEDQVASIRHECGLPEVPAALLTDEEIFGQNPTASRAGLLSFEEVMGLPAHGRLSPSPLLTDEEFMGATVELTEACEAGSVLDCNNLGDMYRTGQGATQNSARAAQFYRQACDGGDSGGCIRLGIKYEEGRGVLQDYARAAQLYRQACEGGDAGGCRDLGFMYHNGRGVTQDHVRAHALYNLAASEGQTFSTNVIARNDRDGIARRMTPQQIAEAQALARRCAETSIVECLR